MYSPLKYACVGPAINSLKPLSRFHVSLKMLFITTKGVFDSLFKYFEMAFIHYNNIVKKTEKSVFCNIIPRFRSVLCLSTAMLREKIPFDSPPCKYNHKCGHISKIMPSVIFQMTSVLIFRYIIHHYT